MIVEIVHPGGAFLLTFTVTVNSEIKKQYIDNIKVLTEIINIINLENTYQLLNLLLG